MTPRISGFLTATTSSLLLLLLLLLHCYLLLFEQSLSRDHSACLAWRRQHAPRNARGRGANVKRGLSLPGAFGRVEGPHRHDNLEAEHLPVSPHISPYLPVSRRPRSGTSPRISPHLPASPRISPPQKRNTYSCLPNHCTRGGVFDCAPLSPQCSLSLGRSSSHPPSESPARTAVLPPRGRRTHHSSVFSGVRSLPSPRNPRGIHAAPVNKLRIPRSPAPRSADSSHVGAATARLGRSGCQPG